VPTKPRSSFSFNLDFITFSFYLALVGIGGLFIYSVDVQQSGMPTDISSFLLDSLAGKQFIWIVICLLVFFFITSLLDHTFWQVFAYLIYGLGVASLVLVLIFGSTIKGATSWFNFGGFSFQPSEIAKFGTCLGVAAMLNHWSTDLRKWQHVLRVVALFMTPCFLILLQPDAGSALVFLSFFIVLFREGLAPILYVIGLLAVATLIISIIGEPVAIVTGLGCVAMACYAFYEDLHRARWLLGVAMLSVTLFFAYQQAQIWVSLAVALSGVAYFTYRQYSHFRTHLIPIIGLGFVLTSGLAVGSNYFYKEMLKPHQQQRIDVWLRPQEAKKRNKDSVFNLEQSKLAIGAGGLLGQGFMSGRMTSGRFVPEQDTDFIFCTIGEEQGFIGSATVVILYLLLLLRIVQIAERQKSTFNRAYAYGVAGILFVHFAVNIGMTMGLMPIIGIPLPFISKGGSSLLGFTIMIAVLLKLDRHRGRIKTVGGGVI